MSNGLDPISLYQLVAGNQPRGGLWGAPPAGPPPDWTGFQNQMDADPSSPIGMQPFIPDEAAPLQNQGPSSPIFDRLGQMGPNPFPIFHGDFDTPGGGIVPILSFLMGMGNAVANRSANEQQKKAHAVKQINENAKALADKRWDDYRDKKKQEHERVLANAKATADARERSATQAAQDARQDKTIAASDDRLNRTMAASDARLEKTIAARGRRLPSAAERERLTTDVALLKQTETIRSLYKPEFVGPVEGKRGAVSTALGEKYGKPIGLAPKKGEADFRGAAAIYKNRVISAISGAAVSWQEAKRMRSEIPDANDPPETFTSKLQQTQDNLSRIANARRETYSSTGLDLTDLAPLPSVGAGQIEEWGRDKSGKLVRIR